MLTGASCLLFFCSDVVSNSDVIGAITRVFGVLNTKAPPANVIFAAFPMDYTWHDEKSKNGCRARSTAASWPCRGIMSLPAMNCRSGMSNAIEGLHQQSRASKERVRVCLYDAASQFLFFRVSFGWPFFSLTRTWFPANKVQTIDECGGARADLSIYQSTDKTSVIVGRSTHTNYPLGAEAVKQLFSFQFPFIFANR